MSPGKRSGSHRIKVTAEKAAKQEKMKGAGIASFFKNGMPLLFESGLMEGEMPPKDMLLLFKPNIAKVGDILCQPGKDYLVPVEVMETLIHLHFNEQSIDLSAKKFDAQEAADAVRAFHAEHLSTRRDTRSWEHLHGHGPDYRGPTGETGIRVVRSHAKGFEME